MFDINNQIPYEVYQRLSKNVRLNHAVTRELIVSLSNYDAYPFLEDYIQNNREAVDRPVSLHILATDGVTISRNYIDSRWNPEVPGILSILELYNIFWKGLAIKQRDLSLTTILNLLYTLEDARYNLTEHNTRITQHSDLETIDTALTPDTYKTFYTIYESAHGVHPKLNADDFMEEGYVKVDTELWNLIVTKAMERDNFEDDKFFKELYYNEERDQYIYYTNTGDSNDKNWTPIAAFLYAINNDNTVQQRFSQSAIDLMKYTLDIFKYKRVTKGEGLAEARNNFLVNDERLKSLKEIVAKGYVKQQFKDALVTNKQRLLEEDKRRYSSKVDELLLLEARIKDIERDLITINNDVPRLMQEFTNFINNKELKHHYLTAEGKFIYTITTPMDFVETDLIEVLRVTSENWRVVNMLRDLYLESNGYIYGTSSFEFDINTKRIKLTDEQPVPLHLVKDTVSNSGNPHHTGYHCLGSYERHLGTMANNLDFTGLFNMSLAAVKNFNVADSAVIENYNDLLNYIANGERPAVQCMVNYNGTMMDYNEYLSVTQHVMDDEYDEYDEYDEITDWDIIENAIDQIATQLMDITNPRFHLAVNVLEAKYNIIRTKFHDLGDMIGDDLSNVLTDVYYDEDANIIVDDDRIFYDFYEQLPKLLESLSRITLDFANFLPALRQYVDTKINQIDDYQNMNVSEDIVQALLRVDNVNTPLQSAIETFENLEIDFNSIAFENIRMNLQDSYIFANHFVNYGDYSVSLNVDRYPLYNNQKLVYTILMNLIENYLPKQIRIDTATLLDDILAAMIERQDAVPTTPITTADLEQAAQQVQADIAGRHIMNQRRRMASPVHQGVREFDYDANDENRYTVAEDIHTGVIGTRINGEFMRFESLEIFEQYLLENPHVNPQVYPYEYRASNGNNYTVNRVIDPYTGAYVLNIFFDGNNRTFENIEAFEEFLQTFPGLRPDLDAIPVPDPERIMRQAVDYATIPPDNYTTAWTGTIDTVREATTDAQTATREEDFEW